MIELDELPNEATNRFTMHGYLPKGIAMVSFLYYKLNEQTNITYPSRLPSHQSRFSSVQQGKNNELIELIHY